MTSLPELGPAAWWTKTALAAPAASRWDIRGRTGRSPGASRSGTTRRSASHSAPRWPMARAPDCHPRPVRCTAADSAPAPRRRRAADSSRARSRGHTRRVPNRAPSLDPSRVPIPPSPVPRRHPRPRASARGSGRRQHLGHGHRRESQGDLAKLAPVHDVYPYPMCCMRAGDIPKAAFPALRPVTSPSTLDPPDPWTGGARPCWYSIPIFPEVAPARGTWKCGVTFITGGTMDDRGATQGDRAKPTKTGKPARISPPPSPPTSRHAFPAALRCR